MHSLRQGIVRCLLSLVLSGVTIFTVAAQRPTGSLRIQVIDPVNALIANAVVIASDAAGTEKRPPIKAMALTFSRPWRRVSTPWSSLLRVLRLRKPAISK